jgi:hypothetical protein
MADPTGPTPHAKGTSLELAVQAIETMILRESPSYSEKTFTIDTKKIVTVAGVRHEIDIWVSVDLGAARRGWAGPEERPSGRPGGRSLLGQDSPATGSYSVSSPTT